MNLRDTKPTDWTSNRQPVKKEPEIRTAAKPKNLETPSTATTDLPTRHHGRNPTTGPVCDRGTTSEKQYTPMHHDLRVITARRSVSPTPQTGWAGWSSC